MDDDIKQEIYWCERCKVPIIKTDDNYFFRCPLCGEWCRYLSKDLRPVFPEERLLFELMTGEANRFIDKSVWCNNSTYFVDGIPHKVSSEMWLKINPDKIREDLKKYKEQNSYEYFNKYADKFIKANYNHFRSIRFEAMKFIRDVSLKYKDLPQYISFSGGKDSTVTADLVVKALGNPSIPHVFCDTTLLNIPLLLSTSGD